ncbi:MAG: SUMF1/EgtB/PvdO family nonheme iron enzyme [Planctomycetaceae bacterium]|nr:SUMF1/EgtB/PvdO family nonheme iron enzyme [Planctomycetaceae bacterium]
MNDPAAARKPKGWPLFAIALLIALLAGFLFLRWRKKEDVPAVVKEPVPIAKPVEPATPAKPDPVEPPTKPVPPSAEDGFEKKVAELKKAVEGRQWADATAALEAARALRPADPSFAALEASIAEGKKKDDAEKAAAAKAAEERAAQERAWALVKEKVEACRTSDRWDEGLAYLSGFVKTYPGAVRDSDYDRTQDQFGKLQKESDTYFKRDLAEAQKQFAEGRYAQAIATAEGALKYYPERRPQVREFQDRAREIQMEKGMVRIPATNCWIGSEERDDEKPLRQVKLAAFLIDKYEVSNEEYYAFTSATNHEPPPTWGGRKPPKNRERHPVVFVTWDDAVAYAKWAGKRLPTAEEWEVAARGPDKREFPWGNAFQEKEDQFLANCLEHWQLNKSLAPGTVEIDRKDFEGGVSAFGVYGMSGNVWEWTSTAAPAKGTKPPPEFRILKGGSFMTPQKALRCANVLADDPRLLHPDVGFRCARDLK